MRIGILGSGRMGGKLGTLFARAGHDVVFSYARTKAKLQRLARAAGSGARAGTPGEAADEADVVCLAVHWSRLDDVLKQAGDLSGKFAVYESRRRRRRPSLVYCGDDARAKKVAAALIREVGFDPLDAGPLRIARYTEPFSLLTAQLAYASSDNPSLAYRFERLVSAAGAARAERLGGEPPPAKRRGNPAKAAPAPFRSEASLRRERSRPPAVRGSSNPPTGAPRRRRRSSRSH